jgi:hypothetical protein
MPTKFLAVVLAFVGLVFTGMFVAIALHAADYAFAEIYKTDRFFGRVED